MAYLNLKTSKKTAKLNTRQIRSRKLQNGSASLQMLTCYDYQSAQMLNQTSIDMVLVGDSLGNVVLGYDTTVEVTLEDMITFGAAVKRGAKDKFVVVDMPFGTYHSFESGLAAATSLFQKTRAEALKLEGAFPHQLKLIQRLTQTGIPVMGHIGLTPQSVHELGGYYTHGKNKHSADRLLEEARLLQEAGAFSIVLECVAEEITNEITEILRIPTIGIGSGENTDGQVLVLNDLLKLGPDRPPKFCYPVADLYRLKLDLVEQYLESKRSVHARTEQERSQLYH